MAHMYQVVRDMYDSDKWRNKVAHMTDNQIMAIFFESAERKERKKVLKNNISKKIEEIRGRSGKSCGEAVASCDETRTSSTDEEIPQQLSFFD